MKTICHVCEKEMIINDTNKKARHSECAGD